MNKLKELYYSSYFLNFLIYPVIKFVKILKNQFYLSDLNFAKKKFKFYFNYDLDISNPVTLNEKIQYLKLHDRNPFYSNLVDKINVKKYISKIVGDKHIIPTLKTFSSIENFNLDFDFDYPIVIKTNNGSGDFKILYEPPNSYDLKKIKIMFSKSLKRDLYYEKKEWQYKGIKPQLLIEPLLQDLNNEIPPDYKIHCFNGEPEFIYVTKGREKETYRGVYTLDWKPLDFIWSHVHKETGDPIYNFQNNISKPKNLLEILTISKIICKSFDNKYVRIDVYNMNEKSVYFGEITFHHMSGFARIIPHEWDIKLGKKLKI